MVTMTAIVIRPLNLSFQNGGSCATAGPQVIRRDEMRVCVCKHVANGVFVSTLCLTGTSTVICIITSLTHMSTNSHTEQQGHTSRGRYANKTQSDERTIVALKGHLLLFGYI